LEHGHSSSDTGNFGNGGVKLLDWVVAWVVANWGVPAQHIKLIEMS
jgi:hypothetical protein